MKAILLLALFAASGATAWAEWSDMREGAEKQAVLEAIGVPLMTNKSRSGLHETWTYDHGGYVIFENGRVSFWQASREKSKNVARASRR